MRASWRDGMVIALLLTGCGGAEPTQRECRVEACPAVSKPAVVLSVTSAGQRPLEGVAAAAAGETVCAPQGRPALGWLCTVGGQAGTHVIAVSAPAHLPVALAVETRVAIKGDCCGAGYET